MNDTTPTVDPSLPVAGSEVDTLLGALERQRRTFAWKCGGLDSAGLQATVGVSTMTLGGLLKHLALVECHHLQHELHGWGYDEAFAPMRDHDDPDWEWHSAVGDSPETLEALWQRCVQRSREAVAQALAEGGLDTTLEHSGWTTKPNLRRMLVDMSEEYARHTGHADLIRESVDGLVGEDAPA